MAMTLASNMLTWFTACKASIIVLYEEVEQHQGVVLFFNWQLQVEQEAGMNLGEATAGTLQVCLQRYPVEILDFQSLERSRTYY